MQGIPKVLFLMCDPALCSKLLQLVAPESLDLRAVNAPPDSIAWVQHVSYPATPDLLGSPKSVSAHPDHNARQSPSHAQAASSLPDAAAAAAAEDGSQPLSSLQDQEAMRQALEQRHMPGAQLLPSLYVFCCVLASEKSVSKPPAVMPFLTLVFACCLLISPQTRASQFTLNFRAFQCKLLSAGKLTLPPS